MRTTDAAELLHRALHEVTPDADLTSIDPDADLRETVGLDSLDFLQLVELLSERTGHRIDEDDYPRLTTLSSTISFLTERASK